MTAIAMKQRTVLIKTTVFDDELDDICDAKVKAWVSPGDDPMDYYNYRDSEPFVEFHTIQGENHRDLTPNQEDSERLRNEILERFYELQRIEKEHIEDAVLYFEKELQFYGGFDSYLNPRTKGGLFGEIDLQ